MTWNEMEHKFYREYQKIANFAYNPRLSKEKAFKFILIDRASFDSLCREMTYRTYALTGYPGNGFVFGIKCIVVHSTEPILEFCPNIDEIFKP